MPLRQAWELWQSRQHSSSGHGTEQRLEVMLHVGDVLKCRQPLLIKECTLLLLLACMLRSMLNYATPQHRSDDDLCSLHDTFPACTSQAHCRLVTLPDHAAHA